MTPKDILATINQFYQQSSRMVGYNRFGPPQALMVDSGYADVTSDMADRIIHWHKPWQIWIKPAYKAETRDCDDLAVRCMHETRQAWRGDGVLPFGVCVGTKCNGQVMSHAWNLLVARDGVLMYDVQLDCIWPAHPELDQVFFVWI